jgi:TPP-dependent pyruvate/acetoin dehydrogenase alpha subunit
MGCERCCAAVLPYSLLEILTVLPNQLSTEDLERLYHSLRRIRRIEEEVARVYPTDKIKSPVHLSIGQEAASVGVIDVLEKDDVVSGSYRGHAVYLAKGGSAGGMIAEMYGKSGGCAQGKGGSMHLVSAEHNVLGASAVVGTHIPQAAGYALALKRRGSRNMVTVFFGDGSTEEGCFYETLNFASLHKLPVLFVCENNGYAIHEPQSKRWATDRLCERVATFGIPAHQIPDMDVLTIRERATELVADIRAGKGPAFLEIKTYRWREHVGPAEDYNQGYRDRADLEPWIANDQVERLAGLVAPAARDAINAAVEQEIVEAFEFAENSPIPEAKELYTNVYAN